jgi:hypothetical protein
LPQSLILSQINLLLRDPILVDDQDLEVVTSVDVALSRRRKRILGEGNRSLLRDGDLVLLLVAVDDLISDKPNFPPNALSQEDAKFTNKATQPRNLTWLSKKGCRIETAEPPARHGSRSNDPTGS